MTSVVLSQNGKLELQESPLPTLQNDEVLLKIQYCGICSSDIQRAFQGKAYFYPLVMGHEFVGTITEKARAVTHWQVGDRVAVFPLLPCFQCEACQVHAYAQCQNYQYYGSRNAGAYAEYLAVKAWNLVRIPDSVAWEDAVFLEPTAVVWHALSQPTFTQAPQTFAIIGDGVLGIIATRLASFLYPQTHITVIGRHASKMDKLEHSITRVCLPQNDDWKHYLSQNPRFDGVLEATGVPANFVRSVHLTASGGNLVWMGNTTGDVPLDAQTVSSILRKEIKIHGTWNSQYKNSNQDDWTTSLALFQKGVRVQDLITQIIPLSEVPETLHRMYLHKTREISFPFIKIVVAP